MKHTENLVYQFRDSSDSDLFCSYFCYYGYILYIFTVTAEEFCKT